MKKLSEVLKVFHTLYKSVMREKEVRKNSFLRQNMKIIPEIIWLKAAVLTESTYLPLVIIFLQFLREATEEEQF